jgi:hydroxyacylglutathione hydrolase
MQLEDHLGDILRKAREAAGVSLESAARLAAISAEDLETFERSGIIDKPWNLKSLAASVGLDAAKFERIAKGWLPQARDLSNWREIRCITTSREGLAVHCYLVWDEVSREAAMFDTGWDAEPIFAIIAENGITLRHLFLTHTHEDHIAAMGALRERFPKLFLHTNSKNAPPQHRNRANDFIHLGSLRITNREVPGHAEDGVIYIIGNWPEDAPHVAVVGDTIFAGSLASGLQSGALLKEKVRDQIFSLPADTLLCPGHGPVTTVGEERENNPFF